MLRAVCFVDLVPRRRIRRKMIDDIINYFSQNPMMIVLALLMLYKIYQSRQPFPETGGTVKSICSMKEWTAIQEAAKVAKKLLIVEFYATW